MLFNAHNKGLNYLNMEDILGAYSKNNYLTDNQIEDLQAVLTILDSLFLLLQKFIEKVENLYLLG